MNVEIRQYEPGDELLVGETVEDRPVEDPNYWKIWRESIKPEQTWTMTVNGNPVAIGGFWPYQQDGAEVIVWLTTARSVPAKLSLVRRIRAQIDDLLKDHERIEAVIRDSFLLGRRWMKFLGFKPGKRWILNGIDLGAQIYMKESKNEPAAMAAIGAGRHDNRRSSVELS